MNQEQSELLTRWVQAAEELAGAKPIIDRERKLRAQVFASFLPDPKEGTNYVALANGWRLKLVHKLDRKVDEAALPAIAEKLREMGINPDLLVDYKPSLKTATYRELTDEQRHTFDQALIMKPGSPTVEMVPPKEA